MTGNKDDLNAQLASLKQENEALKSLINVLPIGITALSAEGHITDANRMAIRLSERSQSELVGSSIHTFASQVASSPAEIQQRWMALPEGLSPFQIIPFQSLDGPSRIVRSRTFTHKGHRFAISEDITEERLMLDRLQDSEERLKRFFDVSIEGILFRHGNYITDANATAAAMLRTSVDELIGSPILDFVAPEDREKGIQLMASPPRQYQITAQRTDGETFPVNVHAQQIGAADDGRRVICFVDATQEEQAKNSLLESNTLFEALSRAAPVALVRLDENGTCLYANTAWSELTGKTAEQAHGSGWLNVLNVSDRSIYQTMLTTCRRTGQPTACEHTVLHADGEPRWAVGQFAPIFDNTQSIRGFVSTLTDITARKRAELDRARNLKQKELLLQEIHHRVKNNLMLVSSLLLLQAEEFSDPTLKEAFSSSQARIQAMALVHSNLYANTNVDRVAFGSYTRRLMRALTLSIGREDVFVHLDVHLRDEDDLNIQQAIPCGLILNELLTNAFKHAFPDDTQGNIWLTVEREEQLWHIQVRDDGVGQSADNRSSLGTNLMDMLTKQLGGSLTHSVPDGGGHQVDLRF